jgi:hypothetical protein
LGHFTFINASGTRNNKKKKKYLTSKATFSYLPQFQHPFHYTWNLFNGNPETFQFKYSYAPIILPTPHQSVVPVEPVPVCLLQTLLTKEAFRVPLVVVEN